MKKSLIIGSVIIIILVVVAIVLFAKNNRPAEPIDVTVTPPASSSQTTTSDTTTSPASSGMFTMAQVATHNTASSCYSAINGIVYDLTTWINRHPGGAARILSICGKDGSSAFSGQHAGEPRPEQILAGFQVGALVQ
jgi:cytochrome b involved in lipid metabolism